MSPNRSPKSITATSTSIVAYGPHNDDLVQRANGKHYELRQIKGAKRDRVVTYELTIFDNDDPIAKHITKTAKYSDAAVWAIQTFIEVLNDNQSS